MMKDYEKGELIYYSILILIFLMVMIWSLMGTFTMLTWVPEALPAILLLLGLIVTYKKFKFSKFVYFFVLIHCIVLLVGAKYTYERNPLFDHIKEIFNLSRNHYDRVGHFFQGFVPAFMAKELYTKKGIFNSKKMLYFVIVATVMGISATYELLEFATSIISGYPAEVVLSYQGSEWDTQYDMLFALIGAVTALTVFKKIHDSYIEK